MNVIYTNINSQKSKYAITAIFLFMCVFSFEGFRAGLLTHQTGITPKLFGLIATSKIEPNIARTMVMPLSLVLFIIFFYMLMQAIFKGVLAELYAENDCIVAQYNGLLHKNYSYSISDIKKITFKTEHSSIGASATVTASGTSIVTERLYIHISTDKDKMKKINLVSGPKKEIKAAGNQIKQLLENQ